MMYHGKSRANRDLVAVANLAEAIALYMAGKHGPKIRKDAARAPRARQSAAGELADSGI